jgi:hypothetical protein
VKRASDKTAVLVLLGAMASAGILFNLVLPTGVAGAGPAEVSCADWPQQTDDRWRSVSVDGSEVLDALHLIEAAEDLTLRDLVALVDQPGCYAVVWTQDALP